MDDYYKLLTVLIKLDDFQKSKLEELLPDSCIFIFAKPAKKGTEISYRFKPLLSEKQKQTLEKQLIQIGIQEFYFQG